MQGSKRDSHSGEDESWTIQGDGEGPSPVIPWLLPSIEEKSSHLEELMIEVALV